MKELTEQEIASRVAWVAGWSDVETLRNTYSATFALYRVLLLPNPREALCSLLRSTASQAEAGQRNYRLETPAVRAAEALRLRALADKVERGEANPGALPDDEE